MIQGIFSFIKYHMLIIVVKRKFPNKLIDKLGISPEKWGIPKQGGFTGIKYIIGDEDDKIPEIYKYKHFLKLLLSLELILLIIILVLFGLAAYLNTIY